MARNRLINRRPVITVKVKWTATGGPDHSILVSYGFDGDGKIMEAFVAAFRADSTFVALVNDACILYSQCLQYGASLEKLAESMAENRKEGESIGPPASMMGAIARKALEVQRDSDK